MADPAARFCPDCGEDISARHRNAKRCEPCAWDAVNEARNRYHRDRYHADPAYRARRQGQQRERRRRPGVRERMNELNRNWLRSPRGKATRAAYNRRPEVKAANAERMRRRYVPRAPAAETAIDAMPGSIPSSLHPDFAGRVTKRPVPRTYEAARRSEFRETMEAAAGERPRECPDCGAEASPDTLGRNGGLCGFCAEMTRRGA